MYNDTLIEQKHQKFQPTGYKFVTNLGWGIQFGKDQTEDATKFIQNLWNKGFVVQVTEATDYKDREFSKPTYQHIAVYVKREDGKEITDDI